MYSHVHGKHLLCIDISGLSTDIAGYVRRNKTKVKINYVHIQGSAYHHPCLSHPPADRPLAGDCSIRLLLSYTVWPSGDKANHLSQSGMSSFNLQLPFRETIELHGDIHQDFLLTLVINIPVNYSISDSAFFHHGPVPQYTRNVRLFPSSPFQCFTQVNTSFLHLFLLQ